MSESILTVTVNESGCTYSHDGTLEALDGAFEATASILRQYAPEFHKDAARWDDPSQHRGLLAQLDAHYDGWAMTASAKTLAHISDAIPERARIAVWHVTNAIPDGGRVRSMWEPVIVRVPDARRAYGSGLTVPDVLTAPHPCAGFVGRKPDAWTRWVLDMLGYQPGDRVDDLFPGSGAVSRAMEVLL